ncbi:hypothetical protein BT63DRAFT_459002 [Microthyrium microscopicum]|uniref:Uncharacterized protein n=1 Tax=Microthyrium microscopicum TaxID=703497 RepID=A0A6A6U1A4_9PEZI|nr:hypothetical protein BT63DRAFT_459002 [Microthyrium microscopicum]
MDVNENQEIDASTLTIQKALEIARNSDIEVDPLVLDYLERKFDEVWARIEAEPESYLLTKDEFALFNYLRSRATSTALAKAAIRRFWDNYTGASSSYCTTKLRKAACTIYQIPSRYRNPDETATNRSPDHGTHQQSRLLRNPHYLTSH